VRARDLISEVRRREAFNRAYRTALLALGVLLSVAAVWLITISAYPRWIALIALLALTVVYLFWILPKEGVIFRGVTELEAGALIDSRFGAKERAVSLVGLRQVAGPTGGAVSGVIERQLEELLPKGVRADDVVTFKMCAAEKRALIVGVAALVVAILVVIFKVPKSDPLLDLLAEIEGVQRDKEQLLSQEAKQALSGLHDKVSSLVKAGASLGADADSRGADSKADKQGDSAGEPSAEGKGGDLQSDVVRELAKVKGVLAREDSSASRDKGEGAGAKEEASSAKGDQQQGGAGDSSSKVGGSSQGLESKETKGDSNGGAQEGSQKDGAESNSASDSQQGAGDSGDKSGSNEGAGNKGSGGASEKQKGASKQGEAQGGGGGAKAQGDSEQQKGDGEGLAAEGGGGGASGGGSEGEGQGEGQGQSDSKGQGQAKGEGQGGANPQEEGQGGQGAARGKGESKAQGASQTSQDGSSSNGASEGSEGSASSASGASKGGGQGSDGVASQGPPKSQGLDNLNRAIERAEGALKGDSGQGKGSAGDKSGKERDNPSASLQPAQPESSESGANPGSGARSPGIDRNAKPRDYDPQGDAGAEGSSLGSGGDYKEVKIEARGDEKFDERFTGVDSDGDTAEAKGGELPVRPRSSVEDVSLAKPKLAPRRGEQPIPLEYREQIK
jgi:hypothetical protein